MEEVRVVKSRALRTGIGSRGVEVVTVVADEVADTAEDEAAGCSMRTSALRREKLSDGCSRL